MDERIEPLSRRGRKLRTRGEYRKAANTYAELTSVSPEDPRWWVLLAVTLHEIHRVDDTSKALRQALYLFRHGHDSARYASLTRWIRAHCDLPFNARAA
ncbi:MAG: tetratricopeptide repeat protein [Deltaproteobacteria bacterium]